MRLIFSRDRPAQLDLLLRSLKRYAPHEETRVIVHAPSDGYKIAQAAHPTTRFWFELQMRFNELLRHGVRLDDTVTFFCDDDVVFRPLPSDPRVALADERLLCHSWRLSHPNPSGPTIYSITETTYYCPPWNWVTLPRTDHGYPGSIDGHTFRTADVLRMIDGQQIDNPTMLETILAHRCEMLAEERSLMSAWPEQVLVSVPVNRVSEQSGCEHGLVHPQSTESLNARWLAGERIALDKLDFSGVTGCHHELLYEWEPR